MLLPWYRDPILKLGITFASTLLSIILSIYQSWMESKQLEEDFHKYWLNSIKGGFGWIPFESKFEEKEKIDKSIDFNNIKCFIPGVTNKIAKFEKYEYNFTDASCQNLAKMFLTLNQKEKSTKAKY